MRTVISNSNSIAPGMVAIVISKSSRLEEFLFHHCTAKDQQVPAQHRPANGSSIKMSSRDSLFSALPRNLWWRRSKACHPPTLTQQLPHTSEVNHGNVLKYIIIHVHGGAVPQFISCTVVHLLSQQWKEALITIPVLSSSNRLSMKNLCEKQRLCGLCWL